MADDPKTPGDEAVPDDGLLEQAQALAGSQKSGRKKKGKPRGKPFVKGDPNIPGKRFGDGQPFSPGGRPKSEPGFRQLCREMSPGLLERAKLLIMAGRITQAQANMFQAIWDRAGYIVPKRAELDLPAPAAPGPAPDLMTSVNEALGGQLKALVEAMKVRGLDGAEQQMLLDVSAQVASIDNDRSRLILAALALKDMTPEQKGRVVASIAAPSLRTPPPSDPADE